MSKHVMTVSCPSTTGIVAAVSGYLADAGCNILDSAQFTDLEGDRFFMRLTFLAPDTTDPAALSAGFRDTADRLDLDYGLHDPLRKSRIVVMVSRFGHCLNDLLYRARIGALPVDIVGVVSNHLDYQKQVVNADIPFHHIPVTPANKPEAEAQIMSVVEDTGAELVVLARYMQILSDEMCQKMSGRIINIHHSFLPSFKGANPYKQAWQKGVRLIGATAHYVTADLDEGPIIEQDTVRVTHAQSSSDYVSLGRDVEANVLSRAVHAHVQQRVFLNGARTVVFPASPGEYASEKMG